MQVASLTLVVAVLLMLDTTPVRCQQHVPPPRPEGGTHSIKIDPSAAELDGVLDALRLGKPKEALERANPLLRVYPDSTVLNCAVGEAAVEDNNSLDVHRALDNLKRVAPQEQCVTRLETQFNRMAAPDIRRRALELAKAGDLDGARQYVASAHLDSSQELIIQHYIDRAQTHFANAMYRLSQLVRQDPSEASEATSLREE